MIDRSLMEPYERRAVAAALAALVEETGSQMGAATLLGVSQPAITKAVRHGRVGPGVTQNLLEYLRIELPELLARYGQPEPVDDVTKLRIDQNDPYPARALALAMARLAELSVDARRSVRAVDLRPGEERSVAWWLRAVLNADELSRSSLPAHTPARTASAKPTLSNSQLEQSRIQKRMELLGASTRTGLAPAERSRKQR